MVTQHPLLMKLRNLIIPMGFSYAIVDSGYCIGLYFWHDEPNPTTIYGAEIDRQEGWSNFLVMGYVCHANSSLKRLPALAGGCGVEIGCSDEELKSGLDLLFSGTKQSQEGNAMYGCTFRYDNPQEVIAEMTGSHRILIDSNVTGI